MGLSIFSSNKLPLHVAGALFALALALPGAATVQDSGPWQGQHWVATWGTAPAGPPPAERLDSFNDQTVRLIVRTSVGGTQVRIRLSNELGSTPLRIGAARVALRKSGAEIIPDTDRALTFGGFSSVVIPPGAPMLSDPVALEVAPMADLAVSLHLPVATTAATLHGSAFQTNYLSTKGNFTSATALPLERTFTAWPFLTGVDVQTPKRNGAIVALGDSITDGYITKTDANQRWPDLLASRLRSAGGQPVSKREKNVVTLALRAMEMGIVNRGIVGNRLLRDPGTEPTFGRAALARFDRDVLATTGVEYLLVLVGINDIGHPGSGSAPVNEAVTADDMILGYRELIARAHAKGITVLGATLTPFEGTVFPGYYSVEKERVRQAVNEWIRTSKAFDGVIDFDAAVRDPGHPLRLLPAYDSGDHLHPNDAGMQAMANAIPLDLFRAPAVTKQKAATR